jgi:hypothetical protein
VISTLKLTRREMAELLSACNSAIQRETELVCKYAENLPWKAELHAQSLKQLESVKEKIYLELKKDIK